MTAASSTTDSEKGFKLGSKPAAAPPPYEEGAGLGKRTDLLDAPAEADEVFQATPQEGMPEYRTMSWVHAAVLCTKTQFGLGILSIPSALHSLGAVPGIIILLVLACLTTYGNHVLHQFRMRHRSVHNVADVGFVLAGPLGREFLGFFYYVYMVFVAGSAMLSLSIALNVISEHGTCTIVFVAVAAIASILIASFRTFERISWLGWVGVPAIVIAVLIVTIAVGVTDRPAAAPATGPFDKEVRAFNSPSFAEAFLAIVNLLFAYAGTPAFFSIIAEMRNPEEFTKSMLFCQSFVTIFYIAVGIVVYYYCGQYVASPALGSAGELIKKIAYGIAIPGLLATAVIVTHVAAKYIFVRTMRNTRHLQSNTPIHWIAWLTSVIGCAILSFIVACAVPFFGSLLGLIGAIFASVFCIGLLGVMWLFDNHPKLARGGPTNLSYKLLYCLNVAMVLIGGLIMGAGAYAAAISIRDQFNAGQVGSPFSCADNS